MLFAFVRCYVLPSRSNGYLANVVQQYDCTVSGVGFGGTKWDNSTGVPYEGTGSAKDYPIYGQVTQDQKSAIDGTYSDTLTATITY